MKSKIINKIKLILMLIIVITSLVFTYLTQESVVVEGETMKFCRPIEFWCYNDYYSTYIFYYPKEDKYEIHYQYNLTDVEVKDGKFIYYDQEYLTDLEDGVYDNLVGYEEWVSETELYFHTSKDYKIIGIQEGF